jgi:transcriptional regulator with XRE-family HTH domain
MTAEDDDEVAIRRRVKEAMKSYRASRHWSLHEMAIYLGISANNYQKYEGDASRGIPLSVIARFCRYTGADLDWIMLGKKGRKT